MAYPYRVCLNETSRQRLARLHRCRLPLSWGQAAGGQTRDPPHPKHGSWLNIAELELSGLQRQCLDRRRADRATVEREVAAWARARNAADLSSDWRFTTEDARIKLKRFYPAVHE